MGEYKGKIYKRKTPVWVGLWFVLGFFNPMFWIVLLIRNSEIEHDKLKAKIEGLERKQKNENKS